MKINLECKPIGIAKKDIKAGNEVTCKDLDDMYLINPDIMDMVIAEKDRKIEKLENEIKRINTEHILFEKSLKHWKENIEKCNDVIEDYRLLVKLLKEQIKDSNLSK